MPDLIGMHMPDAPAFPVPWSSQEEYIYDATGGQIADCLAAGNSNDGGEKARWLARAIVLAVNQKYVDVEVEVKS